MNIMLQKASRGKLDRLCKQIEDLSGEVSELKGIRVANKEVITLQDKIVDLTKHLTSKQIEFDRENEKWQREKREVEHMVGLERKRQEFEIDSAKREVTLTVREENLAADRARFEEQMVFITKRFEDEAQRREDLMKEILERLPTVKVDRHIKEMVGGAINGNGKDDD